MRIFSIFRYINVHIAFLQYMAKQWALSLLSGQFEVQKTLY